jgi:hypothetical protein
MPAQASRPTRTSTPSGGVCSAGCWSQRTHHHRIEAGGRDTREAEGGSLTCTWLLLRLSRHARRHLLLMRMRHGGVCAGRGSHKASTRKRPLSSALLQPRRPSQRISGERTARADRGPQRRDAPANASMSPLCVSCCPSFLCLCCCLCLLCSSPKRQKGRNEEERTEGGREGGRTGREGGEASAKKGAPRRAHRRSSALASPRRSALALTARLTVSCWSQSVRKRRQRRQERGEGTRAGCANPSARSLLAATAATSVSHAWDSVRPTMSQCGNRAPTNPQSRHRGTGSTLTGQFASACAAHRCGR